MKFLFGKYKGSDTSDPEVPITYLTWLEEQEWIKPELRKDLNIEIKRRSGDRPGAGKVVKRFKCEDLDEETARDLDYGWPHDDQPS